MTTQDETIFRNGQNNEQNNAQAAAVAMPAEEPNRNRSWQTVTIGGVAGIAMGVGASQLFDAISADEEETVELVEEGEAEGTATAEAAGATVTEVHQATVDQHLSFGEAFAAARAEVGPGGVFLWHGQLYNTFTAEEWQGMSDAQKDEFAADVQPFLGQQTAEPYQTTTTQSTTRTTDETTIQGGGAQQTAQVGEHTGEPEVHFLGVETREIDGTTVNFGNMTVDDVRVALVDVDNDQIFDISIADANSNGEIEDNEITDISSRGLDVETFQILSELDESQQQELFDQAGNVQEDLAPDMPDYMNDADVDLA